MKRKTSRIVAGLVAVTGPMTAPGAVFGAGTAAGVLAPVIVEQSLARDVANDGTMLIYFAGWDWLTGSPVVAGGTGAIRGSGSQGVPHLSRKGDVASTVFPVGYPSVAPHIEIRTTKGQTVRIDPPAPDCVNFDIGAIATAQSLAGTVSCVSENWQRKTFTWTPRTGVVTYPMVDGQLFEPQTASASADGIFGGYATDSATYNITPTIMRKGRMTSLPLPAGYTAGQVKGIIADGDYAGMVYDGVGGSRPVRWTNGVVVSLPLPPGSTYALVNDANANGVIVGSVMDPSTGSPMAAFWQGDEVVVIGHLPGGIWSEAVAVNDLGAVVGRTSMPWPGDQYAWVWTAASGIKQVQRAGETQASCFLTKASVVTCPGA
jgi:hypothetical protein